MDPCQPEPDPAFDERIASLINEYFDRRQAGEELTPESFATEHPDLAERVAAMTKWLDRHAKAASVRGRIAPRAPTVTRRSSGWQSSRRFPPRGGFSA